MLFCTPYLYVSANQIGNILPQAKNHAVHGVKTPGHEI